MHFYPMQKQSEKASAEAGHHVWKKVKAHTKQSWAFLLLVFIQLHSSIEELLKTSISC